MPREVKRPRRYYPVESLWEEDLKYKYKPILNDATFTQDGFLRLFTAIQNSGSSRMIVIDTVPEEWREKL